MKQSIEFDHRKDTANQKEHGISLSQAQSFDFSSALQVEDTRKDYNEVRTIALGYIGSRLHVLVYTMRGEILRPISLRKANPRERKRYEKEI